MYATVLAVIKEAGFKPQPRNKCFCTQFQRFHCKLCLMSSPDLLQAPHSAELVSRFYSCWT